MIADPKNQYKILVIEDDESFRRSIVNVLRQQGYLVQGVGSGSDALRSVEKNPFDIIISDVRLPKGVDGRDVLLQMREIEDRKLKMILMTGFMETYDPERAKRLGMVGCLKKPFKMTQLFGYVEQSIQELINEN